AFLGEGNEVTGKLIYSVRKPSNSFIQRLINGEQLQIKVMESNGFEAFLGEYEEEDFDYQDIYFMYNAFRSCELWFRKQGETSKLVFKNKLLNHVKLIVNRVQGVSE